MEKIYGMHKKVGLQPFWSRTPTFSSGTPTFCQIGVLNSCFQNPSESSVSGNVSENFRESRHTYFFFFLKQKIVFFYAF